MNYHRFCRATGLVLALSSMSLSAFAADTLTNLPAPVGFTISGTGLPDGRIASAGAPSPSPSNWI